MAKPNYSFEKRQKEIAKKKKQEEKRQRKMAPQGEQPQDDQPQPPADKVSGTWILCSAKIADSCSMYSW